MMNVSGMQGVNCEQGLYLSNSAKANGFESSLNRAMFGPQKSDVELKRACESFESYFTQIMMREMRKTVFEADGLFAKSSAEKIFEDMLYEEYSKTAASHGNLGLADFMYKQLNRTSSRETEGKGPVKSGNQD
jgi:flagellar protein FlgJ